MSKQLSSSGLLSYITRHPLLLSVASDVAGLACAGIVLASVLISSLRCGKPLNSPQSPVVGASSYALHGGLAAVGIIAARCLPAALAPERLSVLLGWVSGGWSKAIA